jgi:hypothetical protein
MWLLPFETLRFTSSMEADDIISAIRSNSLNPDDVALFSKPEKQYAATFLGHRFTLYELCGIPFCFATTVTGYISSAYHTKIKAIVRPGTMMLFLISFIVLFLAFDLYEIYFYLTKPVMEPPSDALIYTPIVLYIILLIVFRIKVIKHRRLLNALFKADLFK